METNSAAVIVFIGRKVPSPQPLIRPLPARAVTSAAYQLPGFTSVNRAGSAAQAGVMVNTVSVSEIRAAIALVFRSVMGAPPLMGLQHMIPLRDNVVN